MGGKRAKSERIGDFRRDARLIRKKIQLNEMAKMMNKGIPYLSRCISGSKNPGEEVITRFYDVFGKVLVGLESQITLDPEPAILDHGQSDQNITETSKSFGPSNEHDEEISRLRQSNQLFSEKNDLLSQNIKDLRNHVTQFGNAAEALKTVAISNAKLVEAHYDLIALLKGGQSLPSAPDGKMTGE